MVLRFLPFPRDQKACACLTNFNRLIAPGDILSPPLMRYKFLYLLEKSSLTWLALSSITGAAWLSWRLHESTSFCFSPYLIEMLCRYDTREQSTMIQALRLFCVASAAGCTILMSANAQDQDVDMTVLADQIRSQGFACSNPTSVERIAAESVADLPVYVLKCESATYQIRLIPDQAAVVTRIE
ncbi:hypothetical protein [Taklimakanibacter deserti]|uniref:hypothetical protein n=1 Tax=Taklimakanibacter deserti TaxID=2267839 RepID=UPI0013C51C95